MNEGSGGGDSAVCIYVIAARTVSTWQLTHCIQYTHYTTQHTTYWVCLYTTQQELPGAGTAGLGPCGVDMGLEVRCVKKKVFQQKKTELGRQAGTCCEEMTGV
jgi:hypothetical protein